MNFFLRKKYHLFLDIAVLVLMYLNLVRWTWGLLGWFLLFVFLLSNGRLWEIILRRVFGIREYKTITEIFSWFFSFILLSFVSSIFVVYIRLTPTMIWSVYLIVSLSGWLSYYLARRQSFDGRSELSEKNNLVVFKNSTVLVILYFILFALGFYGLLLFKSEEILYSPWQVISEMYLLIFFALMLISGIFLFGRYKVKAILFIFILQSVLLHLYLPLSHEMPWGGDVWRHLAVEKQLQNQEYVLPVLVGDEASWSEAWGIDIPDVFLVPQKYTYGQLWGASVLLAETLQVDLLPINKWMIPIIWSIIVPLVLFKIGLLLFESRRRALWLVWLSLLPFSLQVLGSLTLPTSLGFIVFLFVLMLWLHYLRDGQKWQKNIVLFFSVLMLFGYTLYFVLVWLMIIFSTVWQKIKSRKYFDRTVGSGKWTVLLGMFGIFIFPLLELISRISYLPKNINWFGNLKNLVGQFTGYYYATSIRSHDILSGNILFNHTPESAFVENIFTSYRWWLVPAMLLVWFLVKFALVDILRKKKGEIWSLFVWLVFVVVGGYIIGWFILDGDRSFVRRLDPVFAILVIIFFIYGFDILIRRVSKKYLKSIIILGFIILFSWFTTFSYATGPDMRVVSQDEYGVARYIWENSDSDKNNYCVLGDTWILLALEGISAGQIVGGGFPIDYQFGQEERVDLLKKMRTNPTPDLLERSGDLTGAESCWLVAGSEMDSEIKDKIESIFNRKGEIIYNMLVWEQDLKKDTK